MNTSLSSGDGQRPLPPFVEPDPADMLIGSLPAETSVLPRSTSSRSSIPCRLSPDYRFPPRCSSRCVQTSADRIYLDSSAIVKLVVRQSETDALVQYLARGPRVVSCALVRVEVVRADRHNGPAFVTAAHATLSGIYQMRINDTLLDMAADLGTPVLCTLDAIHLAAARRFQPNVEVVTYDRRLGEAALSMGLPVASPGR